VVVKVQLELLIEAVVVVQTQQDQDTLVVKVLLL
jgi:hypothetical protein